MSARSPGERRQLRDRVRFVEKAPVRPYQIHRVAVQAELVEPRVAAVQYPPALHLARLDVELRVDLAVDHDRVAFLAVHPVHHVGMGRRVRPAEADVLQDHDMRLVTGEGRVRILDDQGTQKTCPDLLCHEAVMVGMVQVERARLDLRKVVDVLIGLSGHEVVHDPVGGRHGGDMQAVRMKVRYVLLKSEVVVLGGVGERVLQIDLEGVAFVDPDGRTGIGPVVGLEIGRRPVHVYRCDLGFEVDLDHAGRGAHVLRRDGVLEEGADRRIDDGAAATHAAATHAAATHAAATHAGKSRLRDRNEGYDGKHGKYLTNTSKLPE